MGKILGNYKVVRALRPKEIKGGNSYQNPGSKVCGKYHSTGPMTFSVRVTILGQPAGREPEE